MLNAAPTSTMIGPSRNGIHGLIFMIVALIGVATTSAMIGNEAKRNKAVVLLRITTCIQSCWRGAEVPLFLIEYVRYDGHKNERSKLITASWCSKHPCQPHQAEGQVKPAYDNQYTNIADLNEQGDLYR